MNNPYQRYKEQALSTLTQGELLVKLYEEVIKQLNLAKINIEKKEFAVVNDALIKVLTIINTLDGALNMQVEMSKNLHELYVFLAGEVKKANIKKDSSVIDSILPLFKDLRSSFESAYKQSKIESTGGRAYG